MPPRRDLSLIHYLAISDLRKRYAASAGGLIWAFVGPILTLIVLWLVFDFGLKVNLGGGNFLASLMAGLAVWLVFVESINLSTRSIISNPHLVKKMHFPIQVLPLAAVYSALIVHAVVLAVTLIVLASTGSFNPARLLALPFYVAALVAFVAPLGALLSLSNVLVRDTGEIVAAVLSLLFWATPIIWPIDMIPEQWLWLMQLNPANYLVDGYRRALTGAGESWIDPMGSLIFWSGSLLLAFVTFHVYRRVKMMLGDFL